ncbi:THO complex subunit 4D-like [Olea europaea var. sylvestris]|uniref:THO complex subunit 4D-like n=1 Tax=Olea europaea var. sylvestris TaxID=158386 RepID=UPI000C1D7D05|nr:THO complex subunit 4D-like [Olea europaea var. sylvestris]
MASLDMSLDDMIKSRRNSDRGRGRGRPRRGRGSRGSFRGGRTTEVPGRGPLGINARSSAHTIAKSFRRTKNLPWQNGLFEDGLRAAGLSGLANGTKLYVSNLDIGVTNEDIRELFSELGELIRYAIHYDKNGRPSGSAEVVFARRSDAFLALKRYNNVQLDGKPMRIEIIGTNAENPVSARVNVVGGANGKRRTVVMTPGPGSRSRGGSSSANRNPGQNSRGGFRNGRGGGRGGRGGGRGGARWRKKTVEKSSGELDKELENYHAESMQT